MFEARFGHGVGRAIGFGDEFAIAKPSERNGRLGFNLRREGRAVPLLNGNIPQGHCRRLSSGSLGEKWNSHSGGKEKGETGSPRPFRNLSCSLQKQPAFVRFHNL